MTIPPYTLGYPPDGSSLGATKSTIRNNLDGTFLTLAVDHINNNGVPATNPAGYHKVIHMVPQATDPAAIAGYGQLYSKSVASDPITDTALFWETATGLITQLTANITPKTMQNGYTYLPGGIFLQWGVVNGSHTSGRFNNGDTGTVTFATANIQFPNNCFGVWAGMNYNAASPPNGAANIGIDTTTLSKTEFVWTFLSNSSVYTQFFWVALGN